MTDYKQLCAELVDYWENDCPVTLAEVMERARAALAEPEPEVEPTLREEFTMILNEARCHLPGRVIGNIELGRRLVAVVQRFRRTEPELEGPTDEELRECWVSECPEYECRTPLEFARAVLARWGQPS